MEWNDPNRWLDIFWNFKPGTPSSDGLRCSLIVDCRYEGGRVDGGRDATVEWVAENGLIKLLPITPQYICFEGPHPIPVSGRIMQIPLTHSVASL